MFSKNRTSEYPGKPVASELYNPPQLEGELIVQIDSEGNQAIRDLINSMKRIEVLEVTGALFTSLLPAKEIQMYDPAVDRDIKWKIYYRSSKTNKLFLKEL